MITATRGIGSPDADDHRNAQLIEFRVAIERGPAAATVRINFFLLVQLYPTAVQQVNQGDAQALRRIRSTQQIF